MVFLRTFILFLSIIYSLTLYGEDTAPLTVTSYKADVAYLLNWNGETYVKENYEEACIVSGNYWGLLPWKAAYEQCYSQSWNSTIIGTETYYCANGVLAYYNAPANYCFDFKVCPNRTWTLSTNQLNCHRPNKACHKKIDDVSEFHLLAAIINGESTASSSSFEEQAGIGKAALRKRDAWKASTLQALIHKTKGAFYAVSPTNPRFMNILCIEENNIENEYPELYNATLNAFDPEATDYSNGGCYWDGVDIASKLEKHKHYKWGYKFTDPSHNLYPQILSNTPPKNMTGDIKDPVTHVLNSYDWKLESTAAHGKTIFWKLTDEYLNAIKGAKQCR